MKLRRWEVYGETTLMSGLVVKLPFDKFATRGRAVRRARELDALFASTLYTWRFYAERDNA